MFYIEKSEEDPKELAAEHKRLVKVLRSPSHEDDKEEAKVQAKELREYEAEAEKSMTRRANYTVALKDSLEENEYIAGYDAEVASVAVMNGDMLLMGKRRDNGKWTLPGGHLNPGESPHDGGLRELFEETGIQAHQLNTLGERGIVTNDGRFIMVYAYHLPVDARPTAKFDPDGEFETFRWFDTRRGLPKYVMENLHVTRNFTLFCLGLQKGRSDVQHPGAHGGTVVRYTRSGRPVYSSHEARINKYKKKKPKISDNIVGHVRHAIHFFVGKAEIDPIPFVEVMLKSTAGGPHKYLRKYKSPSGQWVYVYHEGQNHGRVIPEEAIHHLKELGELGDEHAKNLLLTLEEHDKDKLNTLRELGDLGDKDAVQHLRTLGIDHKKDKKEREAKEMERAIIRQNPLTADLQGHELDQMHDQIAQAVKARIFDYLRNHAGVPQEVRLRERGITADTVMESVKRQKSVKGALKALHEALKLVDQAHAGLSSANPDVQTHGSYGNSAYNTAVQNLKNAHFLPAAVDHKRTTANAGGDLELDATPHSEAAQRLAGQRRELAERQARERAERQAREEREARERAEREARLARERAEQEERDRREAGEALPRHQESINKMAEYFGVSVPATEHPRIAMNIQKFFGSDFKFEKFIKHLNPRDSSPTELKPSSELLSAMRGRNPPTEFHLGFDIYEKSSRRRITGASRHIIKERDGSIHWANGSFSRARNEDLKRYPGMARGLYMGVENFLKELTAGWTGPAKENTKVTIGTCANGGFGNGYKGALVWAKHCFDWGDGSGSAATRWRGTWHGYLDQYARRANMDPEHARQLKAKIDAAEYPYQFVNTGYVVTKAQALQMLGRSQLDFDFDQIFENKGYCDIGDLIMIDSGQSWSGLNYLNRTTGRAGHLNGVRTAYYGGVAAPEPTRVSTSGMSRPAPAAPAPTPRAAAPPSSAPPGAGATDTMVRIFMRNWVRRNANGQDRITLSERRMQRVLGLSDAALREFIQHSRPHLAPAARRRLEEAIRAAGRRVA